jgi:predicted deacylase
MRLILLVILVAFLQLAYAENSTFTLAKHHIKQGHMSSWLQPVGDATIPITVINGQFKGPVLTLSAGIHGDEFPPIFALQKLIKTIKPETLEGTLVIVHLANLEGFHGRRIALNPIDGKNLNRVFPGSADGTQTEQIADFMTRELIAKTDYLIDIHSGSWNQSLLPHVYSPVMNNPTLDAKTLDLAKALGIAHIVLYDERPNDPAHSISYPNTAQTRGKPGLTLEVGQLGQTNQLDIDLIFQACLNALDHLNMRQTKTHQITKPHLYRKLVSVVSPNTGIFNSYVRVGDIVKKGQEVGWIRDYFGHHLTTLNATEGGTVLMQKETPPIRKGEITIEIGILQSEN